ncbi:MAG: hypothetical protein IJC88_04270 [Oscillospiraceae bacterium]|nr:hypothetical protein [Oscillospiraceae bacterium]
MRAWIYFIWGLLFILLSLLSLRFPRLVVNRNVEEELSNTPKQKKRYYIHMRINIALLGLPLMIAGQLPEYLILPVCLPFLGILFVSGLVCNKMNLGRFHWKNFFVD